MRLLTLPLSPPDRTKRKIPGGPIYDLHAVQEMIRAELAADRPAVWIGNDSAEEALKHEFFPPWDQNEVPALLLALSAQDKFLGSEWARTSRGQWFDCDAYEIGYNRLRQCRWQHGGLVYVKFGVPRNKRLCVVVRIHPSRNISKK